MELKVIPEKKILDTENVKLEAVDECFVDVSAFSGGKIIVDMQYLKQGILGAIEKAYVRKSVAERLLIAVQNLPRGYTLKIYDAWRPYAVQKALYDEYYGRLAKRCENKNLSKDELHALAKQFVSFPQKGQDLSYVHSSGGAVDLTVVDTGGNELDMGCGFDYFGEIAATDAFEGVEGKVKQNRRLLYTAMTSAGFSNYPEEWWHYDFGDLFWAAATQNSARYKSVYDLEEIFNG